MSFGHLHRFSTGWMNPNTLARFLQPPVTARWRDIGFVMSDALTGDLLLPLLTLTELDLSYYAATAHVEFLPQLPQLAVLTLNCRPRGHWTVPADAVLTSLVLCSGLTQLDLHCGFNSARRCKSTTDARSKTGSLRTRRDSVGSAASVITTPLVTSSV